MANVDQRKHRRYELAEPGFLRVLVPGGGDPPGGGLVGAFVVTILDVSKTGLRIRCSRLLPEGTQVEVRCRRKQIVGEVRYSRSIDAGDVNVGVQVHTVGGSADDIDLTLLFPDLIRQ